jgi:hypothetical protein
MKILNSLKERLDTDPHTPGVQLPPWAAIARWIGDHLAVPVLVAIVAAFVYTLGAIFNLDGPYALLTCAAVAGAVAVHSAWIATARTYTERLYNAVTFGLWMVALLTLGVAAMAISRQNVTGADGRAALLSAGLSVEMITLGEQLYAMAAPLAVASVAPAWLMRKAQPIDGGAGWKAAVISLCTPIAKIAATATSFMHIQQFSLKVGYDQFSAFTGALVADVWFLAASFGAVHWLTGRKRWDGRRDAFTLALLSAFTLAPWLLMLNANAVASIQITGRADAMTIITGAIPVIAAGAFAVVELATALAAIRDRAADDAAALTRADIEADAAHRRELEKIRLRAELRRPVFSMNADGAPATRVMAAANVEPVAKITADADDWIPGRNGGRLRRSTQGRMDGEATTASTRACVMCGTSFEASGRRVVCSDACDRARDAQRKRTERAA